MASMFAANPDDLKAYFASLQPSADTPLTPVQPQGGGLLSGLQGILGGIHHALSDPNASGSTFADRLQVAGGDLSPIDAAKLAASRQQTATDAAQRKQDAADASSLFPGDDPQSHLARLMYASGNTDFRKAVASHFETRAVGGGQTISDPLFGGDRVTAKLNDDNGSLTTQTANGVTQTGQAAPSFEDQTARLNATVRTVSPGGTVVSLGQDPNNPQATTLAGAPAPADPTAASAGGGVSGGSLGDRSNNPGNIRPSPTGTWQGQVGVNPQGYAIFDTPQNGARALDMNLAAQAKHGITTPEALVARWASTSPANEQAAYVQRIKAAVGPTFDLTNPATRAAIAPAIAASEGTHLGGAPRQAAAPQSGARVLYTAPTKDDTFDTVTGPQAQKLGLDPTHVYNAKTGADMTPQGVEGGSGGLDAPTIERMAQEAAVTGKVNLQGFGKQTAAARAAINNRVTQLMGTQGLNGADLAQRAASYRADAGALNKAQASRQAMETAEQTALQNMDLAVEAAKNHGAPNLPFVSGLIQSGMINGLHDAGATQVRNYAQTAANESAKVLSGNTSSGGATDSARREAEGRFNEGMPYAQLVAARDAVRKEMAGRVQAARMTEMGLQNRLRGYSGGQKAQVNQQLIQRSQQNRDPLGILN